MIISYFLFFAGLLITGSFSIAKGQSTDRPWCKGLSLYVVTTALNKRCDEITLEEVRRVTSVRVSTEDAILPDGDLRYLTSLKTITLKISRLKKIDANFIYNAPSLEEVRIDDAYKVLSIDTNAFSDLKNLKAIEFYGLSSLQVIPSQLFEKNLLIEKLVVSNDGNTKVNQIPTNLFSNLLHLTDLTLWLPKLNGLASLDLANNKQLKRLSLSAHFAILPKDLLRNQEELERLKIVNTNTEVIDLPQEFLQNCKKLLDIELIIRSKELPERFFYTPKRIQKIRLVSIMGNLENQLLFLKELNSFFWFVRYGPWETPSTLISSDFFKGNSALEDVTIHGPFGSLPSGLFANKSNLVSVSIDGLFEELSAGLLSNLDRLQLALITSSELKLISDDLFVGTKNLTFLRIDGGSDGDVQSFPNELLSDQNGLTSLTLNNLNANPDLEKLLSEKPFLKSVNLCRNRISSIPESVLNLFEKQFDSIGLSGNPLSDEDKLILRQRLGSKVGFSPICP